MNSFEKLLLANKAWSEDKKAFDPDYFERLAEIQKPEFLWIGCSDSRVPAEIIVGAKPGEIFIHRNIANQMIATDFNCLSVLQYAVDVLEVKHIIVCGHYNCGGVKAALSKQIPELAITNKWLMHVKQVYRLYKQEIDGLPTEEQRNRRMVELNVIEQVRILSHISLIQKAWHYSRRPVLHGWVYDLSDGLLNSLITLYPNAEIDPVFQYDFHREVADYAKKP